MEQKQPMQRIDKCPQTKKNCQEFWISFHAIKFETSSGVSSLPLCRHSAHKLCRFLFQTKADNQTTVSSKSSINQTNANMNLSRNASEIILSSPDISSVPIGPEDPEVYATHTVPVEQTNVFHLKAWFPSKACKINYQSIQRQNHKWTLKRQNENSVNFR